MLGSYWEENLSVALYRKKLTSYMYINMYIYIGNRVYIIKLGVHSNPRFRKDAAAPLAGKCPLPMVVPDEEAGPEMTSSGEADVSGISDCRRKPLSS